MDDILSTALTEAGLDEFFVDDSLNKQNSEQAYNNGPPLLYDKNMVNAFFDSIDSNFRWNLIIHQFLMKGWKQ
jgi:hypothetical protein